ncbi:undecaprenyldiphospho-muramoylpentapeptide beta-N-acetylglucosaminyltransferase [Occallatibacter savannae]|uniref:undecaprenyldiphospho-muramoylpentapeptide beta-N-acetylglucosaminyltransferase n=1 Tax=Occallatibacter savannae TaxID=1002691 RepID=UPI000D69997D|nr:undecaprenyldiphospho-muramoylpentapeptide beta-N-acetylglucosaminyltransferase [Occallatibacter savannae]
MDATLAQTATGTSGSGIRVLIAGGGTGGHIIPALAVAHELVTKYSADVLFLGTSRGMESRLVPAAGFQLRLIEVGPLKNVSLATRINTMLDLPRSVFACRRLIGEFKPKVVLGVGGYASGPGMAAAISLGIPTMAFEPNAMPGLANRLVGKHVQAAAVNFPAAALYFRNAEVTGIPVRPEFFKLAPATGSSPHLLVFGGSQGARLFNTTLPAIAPALLHAVPGLTILHQAGARHAETTEAAYRESGADPGRWRVSGFLDDMPARFAQANLVMARSGASTVAELAAAGKPALLVPFAAAADDHQTWNAEEMVNVGAAIMVKEPELADHDKVLDHLVQLLTSPERLATMSAAALTQAHPQAAQTIAERLVSLGR